MSENTEKNMTQVENAFAGIVINAQTFNPSIFTETWLVQKKLIPSDAFVGLRIFSPEVAQFQTSNLQVLIIPPKMQLTFNIYKDAIDLEMPRKIILNTVELLPHTPYQALGLNFDFFVSQPNDQDFNKYNRSLLGNGKSNLLQEFSSSDAKFGRYFSKDYRHGRLKLDIKPVQGGPNKKDLLQFSFNFHYDVSQLESELRVKKIIESIKDWESILQYVQMLLTLGITL